MRSTWEALAGYAQGHHGIISSQAAQELGIPASSLYAWKHRGRLLQPVMDVYVIAGSPDTWYQRVAVATASSHGFASHRTAAALWELGDPDVRHVEVLTHHGRRRGREGWIVHETRHLRGVDLAEVDGIPCTSVARTILDLAAVAHPFVVGQALDTACRRCPTMLDTVSQRFLEISGRGRKGTRLMRTLLDERFARGRFAQSGFETLAVRLVRSIGLPEPVLQHQVRHGEFVAYLDLAWPPIKWGIECDSLAWHSGKRAHEWDRQRRRKLKQLGWDLVEVTYDDVTTRRQRTGTQIRDLFRRRVEAVRPSGSTERATTQ